MCEACESISLRCFRRLRLLRNCAPALSIIQNGAVGRALPELFHRPPVESLYDNVWPLRHSRRKHCAGFHQSPLWQRQMVQSSTFTSIPAGMIVVPAKQFGPAAWERGGGKEGRKRQERRNENDKKWMWFSGGVSLFSAGWWSDAESCRELGESEQTYRSFHGHAPMGLFLQH